MINLKQNDHSVPLHRLLVPTASCDGLPKRPHHIAYTDWGDATNPHVVICVHGLTRNCRDFDYLARNLANSCRVICVDIVGRGRSDWLEHAQDYDCPPLYLSDAIALITHLQRQYTTQVTLDWIGISMGGLIGMMLSIQPNLPFSIRRLVMSDIGPHVPARALKRIADYVGKDPQFETFEAFKHYVKTISAPFGPLTEEQWDHLAIHSAREHADGSYGFRYDPKISLSFKHHELADVNLWKEWEQLTLPVLILRGSESDALTVETAERMRSAKVKIVEFAGIGHSPLIINAEQIKIVSDFILGENF